MMNETTAMHMQPDVSSRFSRLSRAVAALRERIAQSRRIRTSSTTLARDVAGAGAVVRVFSVDALREFTVALAPEGSSTATPGVVPVDSSLGAALAGGRPGETRRWESAAGDERLQIVRIIGRMPEGARSALASHTAPARRAEVARKASAERPVGVLAALNRTMRDWYRWQTQYRER